MGVSTLFLLVLIVALTAFSLFGNRSRKTLFAIAGVILSLMVAVSVFSYVIYSEYSG